MEETRIDIKYVAALARLELPEEQLPKLRKDLESIVGYIARISARDLDGVELAAHAAALTNVWREDAAEPSYPRDRMLANAPALIDGDLIRVPQVLPGEGSN